MAELKEGSKAPNFSAVDGNNQPHTLKGYKGKNIILYFYPKDLTPGCTNEAKDFQASLTKIKIKDTIVLGVSKDSPERHQKFSEKLGLKFPLLSDVDGKICEDYGVWQMKKFMGREYMGIVRTTFIIDSNGKIKKIFPNVKVKNHVAEVFDEL